MEDVEKSYAIHKLPSGERHSSEHVLRRPRIRFLLLVSTILVCNLVTAVDVSLSASAHVAVASAFNKAHLSIWPVNAFLVASIPAQPLYARLSDHIGRKAPYITAMSCFALGTLLSGAAPSWRLLIFARAMCGLGSAGIKTMGSVLLTDVVDTKYRGHYEGVNYLNFGIGSALGSALGGLLVQRLGWSSVYYLQVPLCLVSLLLLATSLPSDQAVQLTGLHSSYCDNLVESLRDFDWRGSICLVSGLLCIFLIFDAGGIVLSWAHPIIVISLISFILLLVAFLRIERRAAKPVIPLELFRSPLRNLVVAGTLFSVINYSIMYNTPLYFQAVRLDTPEEAGARLVIPSISFTLASAVSAAVIARFKCLRVTLTASQFVLIVGVFGLLVMAAVFPAWDVNDAAYDFMLVWPAVGVGMIAPSTILAFLQITTHEDHAAANGGFIMTRSLGVFIATSLSTAMVQNTFWASISPYVTDQQILESVEAVRQRIETLSLLDPRLRAHVVSSFQTSFTVLFASCVVLALFVIRALARVSVQQLPRHTIEHKS